MKSGEADPMTARDMIKANVLRMQRQGMSVLAIARTLHVSEFRVSRFLEGETIAKDFAVAVHEAGHAVVGLTLGLKLDKVHVTRKGGATQWVDRSHKEFLTVIVAGSVAEDLFVGSAKLVSKVLGKLRIGDRGSDEDQAVRLAGFTLEVPAAVIETIKETEERAHEILIERRSHVEVLAKALLEKRTLSGREVGKLLSSTLVSVNRALSRRGPRASSRRPEPAGSRIDAKPYRR
jgi:hypothetical protein